MASEPSSSQTPQEKEEEKGFASFTRSIARRTTSVLARLSFARSSGQRGASVESLRGTSGADFESKGTVERCATGFSFFGGNSIDRSVYVLIKGPFCFVFKSETAQSPKYAIELARMMAEIKDSSSGTVTVALQSNLGDDEYLFKFATADDKDIGKKFVDEIKKQAAAGEAEIVRKRLGHEALANKHASMKFAENIAMKKVKDQPEKPIGTSEVMQNMPIVPM
mmetsp:Transcript_25864/g.43985  ORF Transcript_25864/g.43985 Transcript_25864/m.43985 type:complete len:223 (-) Transcript_25864:822-1490(-)